MNAPRPLTNDEATDITYGWMPDSKAVLFDSDRSGSWGIFKQGISEDTPQPVVAGRPQDDFSPHWGRPTPDGAWILYHEIRKGSSRSVPRRLMRVAVGGGAPQFVMDTKGWNMCASAPAALCVIDEQSPDRRQLTLTAFGPLKGRGKVLRRIPKDPATEFAQALSPDGKTFTIATTHQPEIHIRLLSLSGGSDREITVKGWANVTGIDWSPDGKGFYCGAVPTQGSGVILYVDLQGNARVLWQHKVAPITYVWGIPSPNGRYLAIEGGVINSNIWMLQGF
jgi:Tol biopolymer transport system component